MLKTKKDYFTIIILNITIIIGIVSANILIQNNKIETTEVSGAQISNTKICWGIKRSNDHNQPDVGANNQKILEDNNGICLGNKEEKTIYLTFDNGYEAGYTNQILDTLKENEVKGTFFITAHYLNTASDLVERMINEGHIVGNHTVNHKSMPEISDEEIKEEVMKLHQAVYEKFGYEMKYIRPPKGEFSQRTIIATNNLGYQQVMWSFAYVDWDEKKQPDEEKAKKTILDNLHNGEIMLLHANSKTNANILDSIIKNIKEQGYEIKSLDEFKK